MGASDVRGLGGIFVAGSILIAGCTFTTTVTDPGLAAAVCFDASKVRRLYDEWAHKAADTNLSEGMTMDNVVASLRATREIALQMAVATAADPFAAVHFKDAADAYLKAPPIPPHASLDALSNEEIYRLETATEAGSAAMSAGIDALNNSPVPFC